MCSWGDVDKDPVYVDIGNEKGFEDYAQEIM